VLANEEESIHVRATARLPLPVEIFRF